MAIIKTDDGAELYYEFHENNKANDTLIFIHGWCSNLKDWRYQFDEFAKDFRILLIDRRGHGRSKSTDLPHTTHQHASDFSIISKELGITDAITICHAGGTPSALRFVADYPNYSKALIIVDSSPTAAADLKNPVRQPDMAYKTFKDTILEDSNNANFISLYTSFFEENADQSMVNEVVQNAVKTPLKVKLAEIDSMAENQLETSNSIDKPVLVISSPWMERISPSFVDVNHLKLCFKNVQLARPIGCGHFPQMEAPEQVNCFIRHFIVKFLR